MSRKPTPADVRRDYNNGNHGYFFDPSSMRFFGDKMSSYGTKIIDQQLYLYRKPSAMVNVFGREQQAGWEFFGAWLVADDGDVDTADDEAKRAVYDAVTA